MKKCIETSGSRPDIHEMNSWKRAVMMTVFALGVFYLTSCAVNDNQGKNKESRYADDVYSLLNRANEREWISEEEAAPYRPSTYWRYEEKNKKDRLPKKFRTCLGTLDQPPSTTIRCQSLITCHRAQPSTMLSPATRSSTSFWTSTARCLPIPGSTSIAIKATGAPQPS